MPEAYLNALIGGIMIGTATSLVLLFNGKIFGVSGILAASIRPNSPDFAWRFSALIGMIVGGFLLNQYYPAAFDVNMVVGPKMAGTAGLIVGFGTILGNGCTSGHGICGISRLSIRSITATITFIAFGAITVYIYNHIIGR
jgi:uncharacterized membrane protein YedE/YeeE